MFKATVNHTIFNISTKKSSLVIDDIELNWNISKISNTHFHVLVNNRSYNAEVVGIDSNAKTFSFKINGRRYVVRLKDKFDVLLETMGLNNNAAGKVNKVKAPMPGLIIELRVKDGDAVKKGDPLVVLEAMKMENIIKAVGDGTVKSVRVKKGDSVEKNQILIEF
jgi:biotin carboxyl carrier protein